VTTARKREPMAIKSEENIEKKGEKQKKKQKDVT
jgi:hypothetical protein